MKTIVIAASMADGRKYSDSRLFHDVVIVTPQSPDKARGYVGPVYATDAAKLHPDFADLLAVSAPCAVTVDWERIA